MKKEWKDKSLDMDEDWDVHSAPAEDWDLLSSPVAEKEIDYPPLSEEEVARLEMRAQKREDEQTLAEESERIRIADEQEKQEAEDIRKKAEDATLKKAAEKDATYAEVKREAAAAEVKRKEDIAFAKIAAADELRKAKEDEIRKGLELEARKKRITRGVLMKSFANVAGRVLNIAKPIAGTLILLALVVLAWRFAFIDIDPDWTSPKKDEITHDGGTTPDGDKVSGDDGKKDASPPDTGPDKSAGGDGIGKRPTWGWTEYFDKGGNKVTPPPTSTVRIKR